MSWLFSQALVAEYSAATFSGGAPSAQLNVMPTRHPFWHRDRTMEASDLSRFGPTCALSTDAHGAALLTWFREASRAKTSRSLVPVTGWMASALGSGRKWLGLLARFDPATCSWRTPQLLLDGDSGAFSETWPRWGSMRSGECWERTTAVGHTVESASGLLPTPRASDGMKHPLRPAGTVRASKRGYAGRLEDWVSLAEEVRQGDRSFLSPAWLESLMAWPIGWSASTPLETDRFQSWLRLHGTCLQDSQNEGLFHTTIRG